MRLSWNEIRARASRFADDWRDAAYEKGETQSFYNDFFEVFGVRRRTVARYEAHVGETRQPRGVHRPVLAGRPDRRAEECGPGISRRAYDQAGEYFDALPERDRPRYILVSDFQNFELYDLDEDEQIAFALADHVWPYREVRLHSGRGAPNLPRSRPGQRRSIGGDGTAA